MADRNTITDHLGLPIGHPDFTAASLSEALEHCRLLSVGWSDSAFEDRVNVNDAARDRAVAIARASRGKLIRGV